MDRSASSGALLLPTGAAAQSTLRAKNVYVNGSSEEEGTARIVFGTSTTLLTDFIGVNVPPPLPGLSNKGGGIAKLDFASGLAGSHTLVIRGSSGADDSRAEMRVVSAVNSPDIPYFQSGQVYLTNGILDAKFSSLIITEGRGHQWSKETGGSRAEVFFARGTIDAEQVILGRSLTTSTGGSLTALPAIGILNMLGGNLIAGSMTLGESVTSSKGQSPVGMLRMSTGATVNVSGNIVTGNRQGTGNACTSIIEVVGGTLQVAGNIAPGTTASTVSQVALSGGLTEVQNGELRIEAGTLSMNGGTARIANLVLTNAAATVEVVLSDSYEPGTITNLVSASLGGALSVVDNSTYGQKSHGKSWTIVTGTGSRSGTFSTASLPPMMRVRYTDSGFDVYYPPQATQVFIQ